MVSECISSESAIKNALLKIKINLLEIGLDIFVVKTLDEILSGQAQACLVDLNNPVDPRDKKSDHLFLC